MRNKLRWVAYLPPRAKVSSGPGMLLWPMSEFTALLPPQSVLMSMAPDATEG